MKAETGKLINAFNSPDCPLCRKPDGRIGLTRDAALSEIAEPYPLYMCPVRNRFIFPERRLYEILVYMKVNRLLLFRSADYFYMETD